MFAKTFYHIAGGLSKLITGATTKWHGSLPPTSLSLSLCERDTSVGTYCTYARLSAYTWLPAWHYPKHTHIHPNVKEGYDASQTLLWPHMLAAQRKHHHHQGSTKTHTHSQRRRRRRRQARATGGEARYGQRMGKGTDSEGWVGSEYIYMCVVKCLVGWLVGM